MAAGTSQAEPCRQSGPRSERRRRNADDPSAVGIPRKCLSSGAMSDLEKGRLVSVPFNVACGRCRTCNEQHTGVCLTVNPARASGAALITFAQPSHEHRDRQNHRGRVGHVPASQGRCGPVFLLGQVNWAYQWCRPGQWALSSAEERAAGDRTRLWVRVGGRRECHVAGAGTWSVAASSDGCIGRMSSFARCVVALQAGLRRISDQCCKTAIAR